MTYSELKEKIKDAVKWNDMEELRHLRYLDESWFDDAVEELNAEEGINFDVFTDVNYFY